MCSLFLNLYNDMLLSVKCGSGKGNCGKSNAKPIFLLSVIECIALNNILNNEILYENRKLQKIYKATARYYQEDIAPIVLPFFHLQTEGFYHLKWKNENRPPYKYSHPSGKYLREHLEYAHFDDELWTLLQNAEHREFLRRNIINRFLSK